MSILKIGVYVEELEDVLREIEIKDTQTFNDLHQAIFKAFQFKKKVQASFFISNSRWQKVNEITLDYSSVFDNALDGMDLPVSQIIPATTKYLIYFTDEFQEYTFLMQVESVSDKEDPKKSYPAVVKAAGKLSVGFGGNIFTEDLGLNEGDLSAESGFGEESEQ